MSITDYYPLTPMQSGMMFHTLLDPDSGVYFEQFVYDLKGSIDADLYRKAWEKTVERNAILRASVHWEGLEEPVQAIHSDAVPEWETIDLRGNTNVLDRNRKIEEIYLKDRARGFDLDEAPLIRMKLILIDNDNALLLLSYHHLILDAWSLFILLKESMTFYTHGLKNTLPEMNKVQNFRGYVEAQKRRDLSSTVDFWTSSLAGMTQRTNLGREIPENRASPLEEHFEDSFELGVDLTSRLESFCREHRLTVNTVVQASWGLLLAHNCGLNDVIFGITISHRPVEINKIEDMVGIFINSLPIRLLIDDKQDVLPWLRQVQAKQVEARKHEHAPLVDIQNASPLGTGEPLFDTLLIFENFPRNDVWQGSDALSVKQQRYIGYTNYPLAIEAMPGDSLLFQVKYDSAAFTAMEITNYLKEFGSLIEAIIENGKSNIANVLSVLEPALLREKVESQTEQITKATENAASFDDTHGLLDVFSTILNRELNENDDFFELGGDSLIALRVVALAKTKNISLELKDIFEGRTVRRISELVSANIRA